MALLALLLLLAAAADKGWYYPSWRCRWYGFRSTRHDKRAGMKNISSPKVNDRGFGSFYTGMGQIRCSASHVSDNSASLHGEGHGFAIHLIR